MGDVMNDATLILEGTNGATYPPETSRLCVKNIIELTHVMYTTRVPLTSPFSDSYNLGSLEVNVVGAESCGWDCVNAIRRWLLVGKQIHVQVTLRSSSCLCLCWLQKSDAQKFST